MIKPVKGWLARHVEPAAPAQAFNAFRRQQLGGRAAAITYYAMLSLFPALLFAASLAGLLGGSGLVASATDAADAAGLGAEAQSVVRDAVDKAVNSSPGALSGGLVLGLLLSLKGASGVINAVGPALDVVFGADPDDVPGFVKRRLMSVAVAAALALLGLTALAALVIGGDLAGDLFGEIGLGHAAEVIWAFARWLVAALAAALAVSLVFRWAPSPQAARSRMLTPGALTVVGLWIALTAAFSLYLRSFADYGAVYGSFAGAVVLLLWLNLTATALLLGASLDAELERRAEAVTGDQASTSARPDASTAHPAPGTSRTDPHTADR